MNYPRHEKQHAGGGGTNGTEDDNPTQPPNTTTTDTTNTIPRRHPHSSSMFTRRRISHSQSNTNLNSNSPPSHRISMSSSSDQWDNPSSSTGGGNATNILPSNMRSTIVHSNLSSSSSKKYNHGNQYKKRNSYCCCCLGIKFQSWRSILILISVLLILCQQLWFVIWSHRELDYYYDYTTPDAGKRIGEGEKVKVKTSSLDASGEMMTQEYNAVPFNLVEQMEEQKRIDAKVKLRNLERQRRTRPPSLSNLNHERDENNGDDDDDDNDTKKNYHRHLSSYKLSFLTDEDEHNDAATSTPSKSDENDSKEDSSTSSTLTDDNDEVFCGINTKTASTNYPNFYPPKHTLNKKSVVLITGILNNIGFHLALKLAHQCHIQVLIGVDPMYPNIKVHTMRLLEQISILHKLVPDKSVRKLIRPYVGVTPREHKDQSIPFVKDDDDGGDDSTVNSELDYGSLRPTHVVHLLSSDPYTYRDLHEYEDFHERVNVESPYVDDSRGGGHFGTSKIFGMRQSLVGLEQLLRTFERNNEAMTPQHFTHVSHLDVLNFNNDGDDFEYHRNDNKVLRDDTVNDEEEQYRSMYASTKLMEETIFKTYSQQSDSSFVGLRLPTVYGPWGKSGSLDYDLAEAAVSHWRDEKVMPSHDYGNDDFEYHHGLLNLIGTKHEGEDFTRQREILFVDDAVDAIITAMQFRKEDSRATTFNISSKENASAKIFADSIEACMPTASEPQSEPQSREDVMVQSVQSDKKKEITNDYLSWGAKTSLKEGVHKLLAWHLDRRMRYGSQPVSYNPSSSSQLKYEANESGNEFLDRMNEPICSHDDRLCSRGIDPLPCMSECSDSSHCKPTMFDHISELSNTVTESCDILLYTYSLGRNVDKLPVKIDDSPLKDIATEHTVCNLAFLPKHSKLAHKLVGLSTSKSRAQLEMEDLDFNALDLEGKLNVLNGHLKHNGWTVLLVDDAMKEFSSHERSLLKLSPGKFFHPSVKLAMFIDEGFSVGLSTEDILFTTALVDRHRKGRDIVTKFVAYNEHDVLFELGKEDRHAVLMLPGLREEYADVDVHFQQAVQIFRQELGNHKPSKSFLPQQRFIQSVTGYLNRLELSSRHDEFCKYKIRHFARSTWVVHDMKSEFGRRLRCEWYKEHVHWGSDLDQISFAHVMARLDVEKRTSMGEPCEPIVVEPETEEEEENASSEEIMTEEDEWHLIVDPEATRIGPLQSKAEYIDERNPYVRILSTQTTIFERIIWKGMKKAASEKRAEEKR